MAFRNPLTRLSQLLVDYFKAQKRDGSSLVIDPASVLFTATAPDGSTVVLDPSSFTAWGGPGWKAAPQGEPPAYLVAVPTNTAKPTGGGVAWRLVVNGSYTAGGNVSVTFTLDPFGRSAIGGPFAVGGPLSLQAGSPVTGLDFGTFTATPNASGQVTTPHALGAVPTVCVPQSANYFGKALAIKWDQGSSTATQVAFTVLDSTGAAFTGANVQVAWVAMR